MRHFKVGAEKQTIVFLTENILTPFNGLQAFFNDFKCKSFAF